MLGIIFGILAIIGVIVEEYILGLFLDFSIMNISIIIIPIGSIIIGGFIGWAIGKGLTKSKVRAGAIWTIVCLVLGLGTYIGIKYMEYETTYINIASEGLSRKSGIAVSDYIGFVDYTKFTLDEFSTTLSTKGSSNGIEWDTSGAINYIFFFVEWLLVAVGVILGKRISYVDRSVESFSFNNMNSINDDIYSNRDQF